MSTSFEQRCKNLVTELELGSLADIMTITPLTGGVSSDIALLETNNRKICVKFALEKLKVAEDWYAPVERNRAEYNWLEFASSIVPGSTPALLGYGEAAQGFAMEFVEGSDVYLWKTVLLQAQPDRDEAVKVGQVLAKIHQASALSDTVKNGFQNQQDFYALRLEPYLCFTAAKHPDLSDQINALMEMLNRSRLVLVHGDVSPKNIIFRHGNPILLDAECATIGDPSFDISFCLNHLILKAIHLEETRWQLLCSVRKFWDAYKPYISWENSAGLEARVCQLLPALMLARVDGKSPVEYLNDQEFKTVRAVGVSLIKDPERSLEKFIERVASALEV